MSLFKRTSAMISFRSSVETAGDVFIKSVSQVPDDPTVPPNNLREEAEELKRCLENDIRTQHVSPVEFINYDEAANSLATKLISEGTSFFNVMWNNSSLLNRIRRRPPSPDLIISRCEELGKWLSIYHHSTSYSRAPDEQVITPLRESFKEKIGRIREHRLVKENFLKKVEEVFLSEIEKLASNDYLENNQIRICKIHEDFTPTNMLVDGVWNIWIIDFANTRIGTSFEDLGRFYESLYTIAQTSNYRRKIFSKAMEAFIRGYGLPQEIQDNPFFLTIRAYNGMINCIADFFQRKYLSFFTNLVSHRMTKASLKWISKELSTPF